LTSGRTSPTILSIIRKRYEACLEVFFLPITTDVSEKQALLDSALADIVASEPDDALEPTFIDGQLEHSVSAWYIVYSTS